MATIQEQIAIKLLEKLSTSGDVKAEKVAQLRKLMSAKRKISPDEIISFLLQSS